jgi:GTP pyrophosphokinase
MRDISTVVAEERVNITSMNLANGTNQRVNIYLTLETKGLAHLSQIMKKIDGVKGVISISRIGDEPSKPAAADATVPVKKPEDIGSSKN